MPRQTSQQRTRRVDVDLSGGQSPQLQSQRRFFSNQGNDRATREARALTNFLGAGQELKATMDQQEVVEGRKDAITSRGAGQDRDAESRNQGYNTAWDQLDAEADLNLAKTELPAYIEQNGGEDMTEEALQGLITEYMEESFKGIDPSGAYGTVLAPGLLKMEQEILTEHREETLQIIKQDQRSKIVSNLKARQEETGKFDYEYLGQTTNDFFDGSDKRVAYWETVFDAAIEQGDVSIIDNVPERFASGDPTGINDPLMKDQIRAARNSALGVASRKQSALDAAESANNKKRIFDLQNGIADALTGGGSPDGYLELLKDVPGVSFAQVTAAQNFGNSQFDLRNKRAANPILQLALWEKIRKADESPGNLLAELMVASSTGQLGLGQEAVDNYKTMSAAIASRQANPVLTSADARTYRNQINKDYNPTAGGPVPDNFILRVNGSAHARYDALLVEGKSPLESLNIVQSEFNDVIKDAPPADIKALTAKTSPRDFNRKFVVTAENVDRVIENPDKFSEVFGGISKQEFETILVEKASAGELTEEQINKLFE